MLPKDKELLGRLVEFEAKKCIGDIEKLTARVEALEEVLFSIRMQLLALDRGSSMLDVVTSAQIDTALNGLSHVYQSKRKDIVEKYIHGGNDA